MSRLAVRAPNWVGDLAMATPVLAAAAEGSRWEGVDVVLRAHLAPLLDAAPFDVAVHPVTSPAGERELLGRLVPDAALLLSTSFRSAWTAWRAGVPLRAGTATAGRRWLLTHAVVPPTRGGRRVPVPTAHLLRDVAGLIDVHVADLHPRLGVAGDAGASVRALLATAGVSGPYLVVSPGAAFGAAKLWPPERFAAALDALSERHGLTPVVSGAGRERELVQAVVAAARVPVVHLGLDLRELSALVAGARLLLVGDSGPRWLAAAFDVPCVSVLGPTFPEQTASGLERARIVRRSGLECAPCVERRCPLGHHRCMTEVPVEAVVAAAEELLG